MTQMDEAIKQVIINVDEINIHTNTSIKSKPHLFAFILLIPPIYLCLKKRYYFVYTLWFKKTRQLRRTITTTQFSRF